MCRYAVVTGADKGIGLEIVQPLASLGIVVVLTARNETGGRDAITKLHQLCLSIDTDIKINNAGASCVEVDEESLQTMNVDPATWMQLSCKVDKTLFQGVITETYMKADECLNTNYYGVKRVTMALLPLLQLSSAKVRIVNLSSLRGELKVYSRNSAA
ncbi:salutaridine reductase-like [Cicer arietinum]|uniref:salutaridine reductase-like n=1 Tax=Cicer arietinum TaxID=3827 RepID=UPI003CC5AC91